MENQRDFCTECRRETNYTLKKIKINQTIGAIWGCVGYTVLLCFTLFKTGSLAKSIFGCH